jgi:hypothetical protein
MSTWRPSWNLGGAGFRKEPSPSEANPQKTFQVNPFLHNSLKYKIQDVHQAAILDIGQCWFSKEYLPPVDHKSTNKFQVNWSKCS